MYKTSETNQTKPMKLFNWHHNLRDYYIWISQQVSLKPTPKPDFSKKRRCGN